MIVELYLIYCLVSDQKQCIEKNPEPIGENPLPMFCMTQAQQEAAKFINEHPAYSLRSWRCEIDKPKQQST
jgi:hypothetical protein